jgi:hypothetical protein
MYPLRHGFEIIDGFAGLDLDQAGELAAVVRTTSGKKVPTPILTGDTCSSPTLIATSNFR